MSQHPNARLTPRGRALLCERVGGGMRVSDAAAMAGVSRQTAHKWLARARRGEPMTDRGCRPRRLARLTPPEAEARVAEARTRLLLAPLALSADVSVNLFFTSFAKQAHRSRKGGFTGCANVFSPIPVTA